MPNRFMPIPFGTDPSQMIAAMNRNFAELDNENVSKVFYGNTGVSMVIGKLPNSNGYGLLIYDADGVPSIIMGLLPDGTTGLVVSKEGEDVLDALS